MTYRSLQMQMIGRRRGFAGVLATVSVVGSLRLTFAPCRDILDELEQALDEALGVSTCSTKLT